MVDAQGMLVDDFDHALIRFVKFVTFLEQLGRIGNGSERIADLVGNARGQMSQRCQLGLSHAVSNR